MAALVAIDPIVGTEIGDAASSSRLPDFSPAGLAAREALVSGTLLQLGSATVDGDAELSARTVLAEALEAQRDRQRIGEPFRRLRNYDAPLDEIRVGFDLMPTGAADDWDAVVARMRAVPEAVAGVEATRREGLARGLPAARRQAAVVGAQALAWGGLSGDGYFTRLLAGAPQLPAALHADAQAAATAAETALAHHAEFLATEYAPSATDTDAVGRERYAVAARANTGMVIDLDATYAWGWEELRRIALDIDDTAAKIVEGGGLDAARELLNTDTTRAIHGADVFREWVQGRTARPPRRVHERGAGWRRGDVLPPPEPGLVAAGPHLVPGRRPHGLPDVGGGDDGLPRGGAGSSPPAGVGDDRRAHAHLLPAIQIQLRARRGLGAGRGTAHG